MAAQRTGRRGPHSGRKAPPPRRQGGNSRSGASGTGGGGWRWYGAGVVTGVFLSFLVYLGTLPPGDAGKPVEAGAAEGADAPPQPRFDFYTMLPKQSLEEDSPAPGGRAAAPAAQGGEYYLLQVGSFRQREDADRRRAELLLLGLEPTVQESDSDNGHWFRVVLGPFDSHAKMARARSLTAAQGFETLLLKRSG